MASDTSKPRVHHPATVDEAIALCWELDGQYLAGGTWIMRGIARGHVAPAYIALDGVAALARFSQVADGDEAKLWVGARVTHARLAADLDHPIGRIQFGALQQAAAQSAFTQVRNVATIGGNVAVRGFPDADLVPALIALDAVVEVVSVTDGSVRMPVAEYVSERGRLAPEALVTGFEILAPTYQRSGFARLTVRKGGEYPIVNAAAMIDESGVRAPRLVIGAVQELPVRCTEAEALLGLGLPDEEMIVAAARRAGAATVGRQSLEAPGWYRSAVAPTAVAAALRACLPANRGENHEH
ncbi:FAD binding domain-containing protein [Gordonia sp. C13]|uniref:FAD binding domain-containing protein n=1 Tax=Gordonia sp. C13 TaxID=2935078 RepID=UPI00200B8768|nr:FAD binding domain-containing protein [Gordonia sp. C13]MCK8615317.1 FAD binding domain-containing protein [Gordonia sp. C13]